ncbi:MAG: hypothetical protein K2X39_08480 [Silvanigrellaceae bacterium]|nr:hypothetical protein [Silvanigrellaceae bacterium]
MKKKLVALFFCLMAQSTIFACASCTSGGDEFLILYPHEQVKAYIGLNHQWGFKNILANGKTGHSLGPTYKDTFVFAGAVRATQDLFFSFGSSAVRNARPPRSGYGLGDTFFNGRFTLLPQAIESPWIPQIQLLFGGKLATGRSIQNSNDTQMLDVSGTGFDELKSGLDIWFGVAALKFGVAQSLLYSFEQHNKQRSIQKGLGLRTTLSAAWRSSHIDFWQITGGIARDSKENTRINGRSIRDSHELSYSFFIANEFYLPTQTDTLRVLYANQGNIFYNSNTSKLHSVTFSWIKQLL